ncbi:MAG: 30S ribosomal protein S2 [Elusimicrobia bacterium]|nr:30S ribosomal protein S2 [Elusimicrobiota bacterium]
MINISMKAMLEAGVHFGHQTRRWNPKMARFIFGERNNIHIIDLQKTVKELKKAYQYLRDRAAEGATILMVGTKKQAQEIVKAEAQRCAAAYVTEKWLGGTLTNFETIKKSIKRLEELEKWEAEGIFNVLSKKEVSRLSKEMLRLRKLLTGIRALTRPPDVIFLIDPVEQELAVIEARKLKIPIVAVCDTNCDPDLIDHPIPGNDDAARSIKLFCGLAADAILEGRAAYEQGKNPATLEQAEQQMLEGGEQAVTVPAEEAQAPVEGEPAQQ